MLMLLDQEVKSFDNESRLSITTQQGLFGVKRRIVVAGPRRKWLADGESAHFRFDTQDPSADLLLQSEWTTTAKDAFSQSALRHA